MANIETGSTDSKQYNFFVIDRELIFVTADGKNIPSPLKLSIGAIGLYTVLKAHAIDKNYAWPSMESLMKMTGIKTKHSIIKYLKELKDRKLIETQKMINPNGGFQLNKYIIKEVDKDHIKYHALHGANNAPCTNTRCKKCTTHGVKNDQIMVQNLHCKDNNLNYNNKSIIKGIEELFALADEEKQRLAAPHLDTLLSEIPDDASIFIHDKKIIIESNFAGLVRGPLVRMLYELDLKYEIVCQED